jgi:hypothetical protein
MGEKAVHMSQLKDQFPNEADFLEFCESAFKSGRASTLAPGIVEVLTIRLKRSCCVRDGMLLTR